MSGARYRILFEGLLFSLLFICFHVVEKVVTGLVKGRAAAESVPAIGGGGLAGIASVALINVRHADTVLCVQKCRPRTGEGQAGSDGVRNCHGPSAARSRTGVVEPRLHDISFRQPQTALGRTRLGSLMLPKCLNLALTTIFRSCNNSFGHERMSGPLKTHAKSTLMTRSCLFLA